MLSHPMIPKTGSPCTNSRGQSIKDRLPVRQLVLQEKWADLVHALEDRYQTKVNLGKLRSSCLKAIDRCGRKSIEYEMNCLGSRGQESIWWLWLRNRLEDIGIDLSLKNGSQETEDELARLRLDVEQLKKSSVARSKISKTNQIISPIDRVAMRVGPDKC